MFINFYKVASNLDECHLWVWIDQPQRFLGRPGEKKGYEPGPEVCVRGSQMSVGCWGESPLWSPPSTPGFPLKWELGAKWALTIALRIPRQ